jgi:hypothetical protein
VRRALLGAASGALLSAGCCSINSEAATCPRSALRRSLAVTAEMPWPKQSRAVATDHALPSATGRALPHHAWRSSVAAAGETTAPSRVEQSVDVGGALRQLVHGGRPDSRRS